MHSERAKVLHPVLGRPMGLWSADAALEAGAQHAVIVVGFQEAEVRAAYQGGIAAHRISFARQDQQLGTGHAVGCAAGETDGHHQVLILCGDTPALDAGTLSRLLSVHRDGEAHLTVATFLAPDPTGYGRIVRAPEGGVVAIVEHRDATEEQRAIQEVNAGVYVVDRTLLFEALGRIRPDNDQGELYLTDVVADLAQRGHRVHGMIVDEPWRVAGINSPAQLATLEARLLTELCQRLMEAGVRMEDPASVRIDHGVTVGADTTLGAGVQLLGATRVGRGCTIDPGCVLRDCVLGDGVHLKPYVVAEQATLDAGATAGPFAHLRPGTELGAGSRVGNFVETKKATLGPGAKANHLSYLGDCEVGARANVGAGTITCNYDGSNKYRTVIGEEVFIGSDTQLVAPVNVGDRATVAAGSTVTEDVPPGALALSRSAQVNKEGYDERHRRPREEAARERKAAQKKTE